MKKKLTRLLSVALATSMLFSSVGVLPAYAQEAMTVSEVATLASSVSILEQGGDLEDAFVKWSPVDGAKGYKAYIKASGGSYEQLDNALIRSYGDYWRADAIVPAGSYTMKIEAVGSDNSSVIASAETTAIEVTAHDRTGYAFDGMSGGVGAYDMNGKLKNEAVVLYITEETKDTIEVDIKTDTKGGTTHCKGLVEILLALKKGAETRPLCFRIVGQVTKMATLDSDKNFKGDICFDIGKKSSKPGITLEGVGDDATAYGWGIRMKNASNIEIRNLGIMWVDSDEGDNIGLQQSNDHVWVHNNDFFYGQAGGDSDQAKGDGALDTKKSTYITMSYNHFFDNGKCCLLGLSEGSTDGYYITYHHNWFDHSDSRHPRIRFYTAHVYNNYYDGNAKYGVGSTLGSSVFVENNYFRNCKYPILTSMQGSDIYDTTKQIYDSANMATFSKEAGGTIKEYGNIMITPHRFINQNNVPTGSDKNGVSHEGQIDAYSASTRDEQVPSSIKSVKGENTYNNFDTKSDFYSYTPDKAEDVPTIVQKWAGRVSGGDFKWTFNNAVDDTDYSVNSALKAKVSTYKTSLKSVGGLDSVSIDMGAVGENTTEAPTETTTKNNTGTTEKPAETTTKNNNTGTTEKPTETTTVQAAGTGKYDFGNSEFLKWNDREMFGEAGVKTVINGLELYYPASGVSSASATAKDGTPLTARMKFNMNSQLPTEEEEEENPLASVMRLKAVKGEVIKVYACSSNGKATKVAFAGNDRKLAYSGSGNSSKKDVTVTEYTVRESGYVYIYVTDSNAYIYKIQVVDAKGEDSSGTNTEVTGDVDGDGVLTVNDAMLVYDYVVNGSNSSVDEVTIKNAFGDVEVTKETAKGILDKVLSSK